jgi:hypothetical protein
MRSIVAEFCVKQLEDVLFLGMLWQTLLSKLSQAENPIYDITDCGPLNVIVEDRGLHPEVVLQCRAPQPVLNKFLEGIIESGRPCQELPGIPRMLKRYFLGDSDPFIGPCYLPMQSRVTGPDRGPVTLLKERLG